MRHPYRLAAIAAVALAAAACGDSSTGVIADDDTPASRTPAGPPALLYRVEHTGGFVPPAWAFQNGPAIAVYDDGTVYTPGAMTEIYPGPAYVPVQVSRIDADTLDRLAALAARLDPAGSRTAPERQTIADAPNTVITVVADGEPVRHVIEPGAAPADGSPLALFQHALDEASYTGEAVGEHVPDQLSLLAIAVEALPDVSGIGAEPGPRVRDWPVASVEPFTGDCQPVGGDAVAAVLDEMDAADQLTYFRGSDGRLHQLVIRPALPGETPCAAPEKPTGP